MTDNSGRRHKVPTQRPRWQRWLPYGLVIIGGFMVADLAILKYRHLMLPDQGPPSRPPSMTRNQFLERGPLNIITTRNIFASDRIIPDPLRDESSPHQQQELPPQPSSLPLTLVGTLVHSNPAKSIAAIDIKGKNQVNSYSPGKEVEKLAKIEKVERQRVIFRNLNNNLLEYIEMAQAANKVNFASAPKASAPTPGNNEVQNLGNNNFRIKRSDVLKYTSDLSSVLMQARAVPNKDPVTGEIDGFRILDMQSGSIYEKLGLQRMDVIKTVNGERVDSIQKAMELYNALKNNANLKLGIDRGGRLEGFNYSID